MGILKMCLELSFSYAKWILQAILSLAVLSISNCVSGSSNFDIVFLLDCTKFCSVFTGYWIGNLMRIPKIWLKLSISHFKRVGQEISSLSVISNCVSGSSNFDTAFLPDCTKFCSVFSVYWIGIFKGIPKICLGLAISHSKWVLSAILSLTVLSNCVSAHQTLTLLFFLTVPNFLVSF